MQLPDDLTPELAERFVLNPALYFQWTAKHGLVRSDELFMQILDIVDAADEARRVAPPKGDPRRTDADMLRAFVARARAQLPERMGAVARVCLEEGKSLTDAAKALGLGRETVRTYLRRLREIARRDAANRLPGEQPQPTTIAGSMGFKVVSE